MNKNKQLIKIEIPEKTSSAMKKNKWINNAIWAVVDIIIWIQEDIDKWFSGNVCKRKK